MPELQYLGGEHGRGQLESALRNPAQTFGGRFLYRTIYEKAAILLWTIIKGHALVDGNKRIGLTATFVFMLANGYLLYAGREDSVAMCLRIASSEDSVIAPEGMRNNQKEVDRWLRRHSISIDRLLKMSHDEAVDWIGRNAPPEEFVEWGAHVIRSIGAIRQLRRSSGA